MQVQDYSPNKADWYHSQRITDDEYLPGVRDVATESLRETPTSNEVSEDPGGTWTHRLRCRPK